MQRKTSQNLIPLIKNKFNDFQYDLYPSHELENGLIKKGYSSLANELSISKTIIFEGYIGVDWEEIQTAMKFEFQKLKLSSTFINIEDYLKSEDDISELIKPFLGGDDPIFGVKAEIKLSEYFDIYKLNGLSLDNQSDIQVVFGTGASLANIKAPIVYFDLPKNELQFRMRANQFTNLGYKKPKDYKQMYKHLYFIDWPILNKIKKEVLPSISIFVDQQRPGNPVWIKGESLRTGLNQISKSPLRVRPWFEPGVWGGQWIKKRIKELNQNVPNYAWSFEMIVPENGLLFESNQILLEVSFDLLMYQESKHVLGKAEKIFGDEFPIRFDFLDTFDGGNLSVQCHPKPNYIKEKFRENITQDETYYILDAGNDAEVYLGFQEDINQKEFRNALEHSYETKTVLDVEKYVQKIPAKKHDLFLIPHGTIHCSGINNLVLEISATPYIFTFKMYDWLRLDLDGNPRPLNIKRAFENLNFERKGKVVQETLISKPVVEERGENWQKIHLPTHQDHFYDVYRYDFIDEVEICTKNQCHVLMLVEGASLEVLLENQKKRTFNYAETFAIPAAVKKYTLVNKGNTRARVIVSFVKNEALNFNKHQDGTV